MTHFVSRSLCTDGYALVTADTATRIDEELEPYRRLTELRTWGEFRREDFDFELVQETVQGYTYGGSFDEYLCCIEAAAGTKPCGMSLEERWNDTTGVDFHGSGTEYPSDDDSFSYNWGYGGDPEFEIDMVYQAWTLDDLPAELLEEFDIEVDTTLDGFLGEIRTEDFKAVCKRLRRLGHTVD